MYFRRFAYIYRLLPLWPTSLSHKARAALRNHTMTCAAWAQALHLVHLKRRLLGSLHRHNMNLEPSHPCLVARRSTRLSRTKRAINFRVVLPTRRLPSTPSAEIAPPVSRTTSMRCPRPISRGLMAWAQVLHLVHLKRRLNLELSLPCRVVRGSTRLSKTKRAIRSRGELLVHRLPSMPTARTAHLASRTTSTRGPRRISRGLTEPEAV